MPPEDVRQPFLLEHFQRFPQAVQQVRRRSVWEESPGVVRQHFFPSPVALGQFGSLAGLDGFRTHRIEGEPGWKHQTLLRAAHRDVHAPLIMPIVDRRQRRNGVHQQQAGVFRVIDRTAHGGDIARDAGRSLVVDHHNRLDLVVSVVTQFRGGRRRVHAVPPVAWHEVHPQAEVCRHFRPKRGEMPGLERQHPVSGTQGVDQGGLPRARTGRREDDHGIPSLENGFHALQASLGQFRELRARDGQLSVCPWRAEPGPARWSGRVSEESVYRLDGSSLILWAKCQCSPRPVIETFRRCKDLIRSELLRVSPPAPARRRLLRNAPGGPCPADKQSLLKKLGEAKAPRTLREFTASFYARQSKASPPAQRVALNLRRLL